MNTYNENLRSSVAASLQSQELDQKAIAAQLNASMFTLHYAEGATITAKEKLDQAQSERDFKDSVKQQAIISSNISNNQLFSATQANQYVKQSITNTAVCAANVQVASNAIVKLASDLGSIYSIVNAADSGSDIFQQAEEVRNLINITAYEAELASQMGMNASKLVAEVPAATVLDKSTSTNSAMSSVLTLVSSEYDAASQAAAVANANLASVSAKKKVAEGIYEDANADNTSTNAAYALTNNGLNQNLTAKPKPGAESTNIIVDFNFLKNPFAPAAPVSAPSASGIVNPPARLNLGPVKSYYVIFVKYSKKTTFSLNNAESLVLTSPGQYVLLDLPAAPATASTGGNPAITYHYDATRPNSEITGVMVDIAYNEMSGPNGIYTLSDSDGDAIQPGVQYVAFVMAIYTDEYKRKLNNYDDYLSAASPVFCLTNILKAVTDPIYIQPIGTSLEEKTGDGANAKPAFSLVLPTNLKENPASAKNETYWIGFNISEQSTFKVDYRCMFLPATMSLGMLTDAGADDLEGKIASLQAISDIYDPEIAKAEAELSNLVLQIQALETSVTELTAKADATKNADLKDNAQLQKEATDALTNEQQKLAQAQAQYTQVQSSLKSNKSAKQTATSNIDTDATEKLDFMFNLTIAEQVLAGNYISATMYPITTDNSAPGSVTQSFGFATIGPETTDIFGNPLGDPAGYYLVVLSYSDADEANLSMFTNAISNSSIVSPSPFIYKS